MKRTSFLTSANAYIRSVKEDAALSQAVPPDEQPPKSSTATPITAAYVPGPHTIDVPRGGLYSLTALDHSTLMTLHMFGLLEERGYLIENDDQLLAHADGTYKKINTKALSCPTATDSNNAMTLRIRWAMNSRGRPDDSTRYPLIPQGSTVHAEELALRSTLPDARGVPADAVCPRQLGSSLRLVQQLGELDWTYAEMVDLHRLAFFDLVPGALWNPKLSSQFKNLVKRLCPNSHTKNKNKAAIRPAIDELVKSIRQRAQWLTPLAPAQQALSERLQFDPAPDPQRLQEQIQLLRCAFQPFACAALRDNQPQIYKSAERQAMQWMARARAKAPALPQDAFHLLKDAPDDLIVALHEHKAAVVKTERQFEGGEVVYFDPRWLA